MKSTIILLAGFALATAWTPAHAQSIAPEKLAPIPADQLGAVAGKQYQGEGLSITATPDGAALRCVFQRMEGRVTREGLWLASTAENSTGERFRVVSRAVGREGAAQSLPRQGTVDVTDKLARFIRPGMTEEYSVSMDGVRQDFIIAQRPVGEGKLRVELDVAGAKAEPLVQGARLTLDGSGRKIAYSRLRVVDAQGRELPARMEVIPVAAEVTRLKSPGKTGEQKAGMIQSLLTSAATEARLAVVVDDANASYPVRIDPTFSDADWISMGSVVPGANNSVRAAVVDSTGNLYIGGVFQVVGDVFATNVARWDGNTWSALGAGLTGGIGTVLALVVSGTDLYAAGSFTNAGGIAAHYLAKWDGSAWSALGTGLDSFVQALAVSGTNLYAGGFFTNAGGTTANRIAKWDGSVWSPLGSGIEGTTTPYVLALAVSGTNLYAGGIFTMAGGMAANNIARWNGSAWSALGSGCDGTVEALAVSGTAIYAGGSFTTAGGIAARFIARWNGSAWSPVGSGTSLNSFVYALAVSGTDLYAGGIFTTAGATTANYIAKWNGSAWSPLGTGMDQTVEALAVFGTDLYAGGLFTAAGGAVAHRVAKWDGNTWSSVVSPGSALGFNARILALTASGSDLYAGGDFTNAGGAAANRIAKWDGSAWSALGSGMSGAGGFEEVYNLALSGTDLYVGGFFAMAGGIAASNIAKWDGSAWSALGPGLNHTVEALAVSGTDLYAGGSFTRAGNTPVNAIAKWNGSEWSALGSGMALDPPTGNPLAVYALAIVGTDLYAGGRFGTAGGVNAFCIAKWNGSAWSAVGSGINNVVYSLLASGTDLYVGGVFSATGGAGNRIAKWNGSTWSALGSGMNANVDALALIGTDLYAGGYFTTADGITVNRIAKWDGNAWSALGSGMNADVYALAQSGGTLYAGGFFTIAGNKVSAFAARANLGQLGLQHVTATEGNTGTVDAIIAITLSSNHTEVVSVDYTTADGSAVAGSDYAARSGTVVFNPGETSQTIVVPVIGDFEDENTEIFYVRLSNPTNITLTVTQAVVTIADDDTSLAITQQPRNQGVRLGSNATFTVAAVSSYGMLTYQWRFNGTNISGATSSNLVITNVQLAHEGTYSVVVADSFDSVTSSNATLTVLIAPAIVQQPLSQSVVAGGEASFSASISGYPPPYTYYWRRPSPLITQSVSGLRSDFITFNTTAAGFVLAPNMMMSNFQCRLVVSNLATIGQGVAANFTLTLLADSDGDGLPDVWETANPACTDPALDCDNDGLTNLEEYRAGTDPTNAASVLRITRLTAGNPATLEFEAVSNKTYTVQHTDRLPDGLWSKLADVVARATNRTESAIDAGAGTNRYYRLVTPRQP